MPFTDVYSVTCGACGEETKVSITVWPRTRWEPAEGDQDPYECPKCRNEFNDPDGTDGNQWVLDEPPEPDYEPDYGDWRDAPWV